LTSQNVGCKLPAVGVEAIDRYVAQVSYSRRAVAFFRFPRTGVRAIAEYSARPADVGQDELVIGGKK
jgi:hypothetical protein